MDAVEHLPPAPEHADELGALKASGADWPGLRLSEGFQLDRLGRRDLRAMSWEELGELQSIAVKALFGPLPSSTIRRGSYRPRRRVERAGLTLDQRVWLRGLR